MDVAQEQASAPAACDPSIIPAGNPGSKKQPRRSPGEGSLFWHEKRGRWFAIADLGRRRGKRIRMTHSDKKKASAARWLHEILRKYEQGMDVQRAQRPLAEWLTEWLAGVEKKRTPHTHERYELEVRQRLIPSLGRYKLGKLSMENVEDYLADQQEEEVSIKTIRYSVQVLGTALAVARRKGLILQNVARMVDLPAVETEPIGQALTPAEVRQLVAAAGLHPLGNLFIFLVTSGVRISEAVGTRTGDIDFANGSLLVQKQLQWRTRTKQFELRPLKNKRARLIALGTVAVAALRKQQQRQPREQEAAGAAWYPPIPDLVFTTETDQPWHSSEINRKFHQFLTDAGIRQVRLHDLRHTHGSLLANKQIDDRIVGAILGHEGKSITARIYTHPDWPNLQHAARVIDGLLQAEE